MDKNKHVNSPIRLVVFENATLGSMTIALLKELDEAKAITHQLHSILVTDLSEARKQINGTDILILDSNPHENTELVLNVLADCRPTFIIATNDYQEFHIPLLGISYIQRNDQYKEKLCQQINLLIDLVIQNRLINESVRN